MSKKKIMIVEDNTDLVNALTKRLRANSYDTIFALDAVKAIQLAHEEKPDLIILDIGLPKGDGFSVMKKLDRSVNLSKIPVIVMTAQNNVMTFKRSFRAGVAAFFQKPVDDLQLLSIVETVLGEPSLLEEKEK